MIDFYNVPIVRRHAIKEGADYTLPDGTVVANHRLTTPAEPSLSYAYCSDTAYNPLVAEAVKGVDVIYHEATYAHDQEAKARPRGHSTAAEAARIALDAGAKKLIIGHYSKSYNDETMHLDDARSIFPQTIAANEGLSIDISE